MVLTVSSALSPVTGLFATVALRIGGGFRPVGRAPISARLDASVGASCLSIAATASIVTPLAKAADPQLWTFCAGTQWVPVDQRLVACKAIISGNACEPSYCTL
jgi:hypothetical protein